jgi:hypothetical protein
VDHFVASVQFPLVAVFQLEGIAAARADDEPPAAAVAAASIANILLRTTRFIF